MWLTGKIIPLESTSLLLSILFKVSFISESLIFHFSDLFNFIVIDNQLFSIKWLIMKSLLSSSCSVWLFVANESILVDNSLAVIRSFSLNSNTLKLTEFLKNLSDLALIPIQWEVLNVKIDSLLRALESDGFHKFLLFSLRFFQGWSNIKLESIWIICHLPIH